MNYLFYLGMLLLSPYLLIGFIGAIKEEIRFLKTFNIDLFRDWAFLLLIPAGIGFIIAGVLWTHQ